MTPEQLQQLRAETQARLNAASEPAQPQRSLLESGAQKFNTALMNFGVAATGGAAIPLAGLVRWAASPLTGADMTLAEQIEGRRAALRYHNQQAGFIPQLVGDVAGAFSPGGVPMAMGQAGMKVAAQAFRHGAERVVPRMLGQGGAAIAEGALYDTNLGRMDLTTADGLGEAGTSALLRGVLGASAQGALDGGAAFMHWLRGGRNAANVEEALMSARGSTTGGLAPDDFIANPAGEGQGYMNALERSDDPVAMANKVAPYIITTPAPAFDAGKMFDDALSTTTAYRESVERQVIDTVNAAAKSMSPGERLARLNDELRTPRQVYSDMLRVDGSKFVTADVINGHIIRAFGGRATRGPSSVLRNLSRQEVPQFQAIARDLRRMQGQDGRIRVSQLVTFKKSLDQMLNPMYSSAWDRPLTPAAAAKIRDLKNRITNQIDSMVSVDYKRLNRQFADQYEIEEAFEAGQKAFGNRTSLGEVQDFLNTNPNDAILQAYREGFSSSLSNSVGTKGYMGAINNMFGDVGEATATKTANIEKLRSVMGDGLTDAILSVATTVGPRVEAAEIIEAAIRAKRNNPNARDPQILKEYTHAAGGALGNASQTRSVEAVANIRTRATPKTGETIMNILGTTGREHNQAIENLYRTLMRNNRIDGGTPISVLLHDVTGPEDRPSDMILRTLPGK